MTSVGFGVGCQRKPLVLFGLARKPLLLFRHRRGIRTEKAKSVESIAEYVIIQFSRLRFVDDLPRFVETLQGDQAVAKVCLGGATVWGEAEALAIRLRSPLILSLPCIHVAQTKMCSRGLAGSAQSPPERSGPLYPVPRLHSDSTWR